MNKIYSAFKTAVLLVLIISILSIFQKLSIQENGLEKKDIIKRMENEKLENLFNDTLDAIPIKGLSLAITKENETIYSRQFGSGIDEHTSFILGSTSKPITAVAVLMIIRKYGLSINDYANKYLPWIRSEITLLDLLNHTSGISTYEKMNNIKYLGEHGKFEYSNTNYNIFGEIIEVVTNDTFSHYVETQIFEKLNMSDSFALSENTLNRIIRGYQSYFGIPVPYNPKIPDKSTWIQAPSGYLCSSTSDMAKYLQFMLEYSPDNSSLLGYIQSNGIAVHDNAAINGIFANTGLYGLGWIYKNVGYTDILYHTGKTASFTSLSILVPQKNLTITILCNMGDFLVGTNLIEKFYEDVISVALETDGTLYIDKNAYWKQHGIINLILLLLFLLSILPLILLFMTGKLPQAGLFSICKFLFIHVITPILVISIFPIIQLPYEVAYDFAPDILFIAVINSFILFLTGVLKLVLMCMKR